VSTLVVGGGLIYEIHKRRIDDRDRADERRSAQANHARLVSVRTHPKESANGQRVMRITVENDGPAPIRAIYMVVRSTVSPAVTRLAGPHFVRAQSSGSVDTNRNDLHEDLVAALDAGDYNVIIFFVDSMARPWTIRDGPHVHELREIRNGEPYGAPL
jgi:hypothetical protein